MTLKFKNCDFSNAGIDGINIQKTDTSIEFINTTTNNNGRNGVTIAEGSDVSFDGLVAKDNGSYGVQVISEDIYSKLGLPESTDIEELKKLISELKRAKENQKENIVKSSFLSDFLANTANGSTIVANIILFADKIQKIF